MLLSQMLRVASEVSMESRGFRTKSREKCGEMARKRQNMPQGCPGFRAAPAPSSNFCLGVEILSCRAYFLDAESRDISPKII
jgi:hypothetical protein